MTVGDWLMVVMDLAWVVLLIEQCWGELVVLVEWAIVLGQWVVVLVHQFLCGQLEVLGMGDNRVRL